MSTATLDLILNDYHHVTANKTESLAAIKNTTLVITGGTGFVGTWLAGLIAFLNDHHAFNVNLILIGRNIEHFKMTRPHLAKRNDIQLLSSDIRYLAELPQETNWLIHAASNPDNRFHASSPMETMSIIANGTYSILRAIERCADFKMLLNLSSGLIYGSQPMTHPAIDEHYIGAPKCGTVSSAYAEAKRFAETLCHSSRSQARIPVITARPFAFIGPYQSLERPWAINHFIKDALSHKPIRVLGDGGTIRSYLYASDMAFWLLSILTRGQSGEIYNLGSDEAVTLKELAAMITALIDPAIEIQLSTASNQPKNSRFVPEITFAQNNLQLAVTTDLHHALKKTIAWNTL